MKSQEKPYDSVFNKREWLYINDTTTQYDQGTSIIETTLLSNNSKFLDLLYRNKYGGIYCYALHEGSLF